MKCMKCGEQPFSTGKLFRYQLTAGNAAQRFKCEKCSTNLVKKELSFTGRIQRVGTTLSIVLAAIVLYYFITELLFDEPGGYIWLVYSICFVAAFTFLASRLDLKFISFEEDSNTEPVMIMKIRKPSGLVFTGYLVLATALIIYYLNYLTPLLADPVWDGILFIIFFGLILGLGGYLLRFYSEKVLA